jgi:Protein of unknown function (DUF3343)
MTMLFTFVSVHHALKAEKILRDKGLELDIIPTPRSISASCGMSIVLATEVAALAEEHMLAAGVQVAGKYHASESREWSKDGGEC